MTGEVEVVAPETAGPYEARVVPGGMPTNCCDYGVVSLSAGREICRTWLEQDARAIAASLEAASALEALRADNERLVKERDGATIAALSMAFLPGMGRYLETDDALIPYGARVKELLAAEASLAGRDAEIAKAVAEAYEDAATAAETAHERWRGQDPCPVSCDITACEEIAAAIRARAQEPRS